MNESLAVSALSFIILNEKKRRKIVYYGLLFRLNVPVLPVPIFTLVTSKLELSIYSC